MMLIPTTIHQLQRQKPSLVIASSTVAARDVPQSARATATTYCHAGTVVSQAAANVPH
jgi:hypothetical protein